MGLWNYCAVCGKRIETGEPCIGVKEYSEHLCGDSICLNCAKIENLPGGKDLVSITDLIARAEAAEARAKKAERERDSAIETICTHCEYFPCKLSDCLWWRGKKEE